MDELEFNGLDSASAGALGEPGNRVFMIQGKKENISVAVVVEKQQIENLSVQSIEFLDSIAEDYPDEIIAAPDDFDKAGDIQPLEPLFRARSMGLLFDPETMMVTLELRENPHVADEFEFNDDEISKAEKVYAQERVVRLTMTRTQLRAMAVKGNESVLSGREPCPLCLEPMDLVGHICPRLN